MWFWKSNIPGTFVFIIASKPPMSSALLSSVYPPNHRCLHSSVCLHTPDFFSIASKVLIFSVLPLNHQRLQYFLKATILFTITPKPLMSSLLPLNYRCPQYCFQTNKNQRLGYIRSTSSQYKYMYFNFTQMVQYSILQTNRKTSQASHIVKCTTNET